MATTITAPVKQAARSGEYDPAVYPQSEAGSALADIAGASTTAAGSIKVTVSCPEPGVPTVSVFVTAASSAYTTAGKFTYVPSVPGLYTITVLDVTAGETVSTIIEVFSSEGV